jgi:hypothetical protein
MQATATAGNYRHKSSPFFPNISLTATLAVLQLVLVDVEREEKMRIASLFTRICNRENADEY